MARQEDTYILHIREAGCFFQEISLKRVQLLGFMEMPEKIMKSLKIRKQPGW